jgi:hypothetical protein
VRSLFQSIFDGVWGTAHLRNVTVSNAHPGGCDANDTIVTALIRVVLVSGCMSTEFF